MCVEIKLFIENVLVTSNEIRKKKKKDLRKNTQKAYVYLIC